VILEYIQYMDIDHVGLEAMQSQQFPFRIGNETRLS